MAGADITIARRAQLRGTLQGGDARACTVEVRSVEARLRLIGSAPDRNVVGRVRVRQACARRLRRRGTLRRARRTGDNKRPTWRVKPIAIELQPAATIRGIARFAGSGLPVRRLRCNAGWESVPTDAQGRFRLDSVLPGTVVVECFAWSLDKTSSGVAELTIEPGRTTDVEVIVTSTNSR